MSGVLDMSRDFDNVVYMQNLIGTCEIKRKKLKNIINNLDKKEKEFIVLDKQYASFCDAKEEFCAYKNSFWCKHFGFLPQVRDKFSEMDSKYRESLDRFKCELNKMGIADEKAYLVRNSNFNRHYAKRAEFEERLFEVERKKSSLMSALKKLNVRVLDECLSGLSGELLSVAKDLTSEQILTLKELNLQKIDYKSLLKLYEECTVNLKKLKDEYTKASSSLIGFSNVSRAISLYKKACLKENVLSAAAGKVLVNKVKLFMVKHNIKSIDEIHRKQLELKKEIEDTLQKIDDTNTRRDRIRPLLEVFRGDIQKCEKKCESRKSFNVQ